MKNKFIICISDNLQLLEQLNNYLRSYAFSGFNSPDLALKDVRLEKHVPDVIFLDLPHQQAVSFCEQLHLDTGLSLVPVLLIIPETVKQNPSDILAMGASDFIHSPLKPDQVMAVLDKHINTRQKWWDIYHIYSSETSEGIDEALNEALNNTRKQTFNTQDTTTPKEEEVPRDFNHFKEFLLDRLKPDQMRRHTLQNYKSLQVYELGEAFYLDSFKVCTYLSEFLSLELLLNFDQYEHFPGAVPIQFCRKNILLPLKNRFNQTFIAMANPFQLEVIDILNQVFKKYNLLLAPPELIEAELDPNFQKSTQYREWKVRNAIRLNTLALEQTNHSAEKILPGAFSQHTQTHTKNAHFPEGTELIFADDQDTEHQQELDYFYHGTSNEDTSLIPQEESDNLSTALEYDSEDKLNRAYQAYRDKAAIFPNDSTVEEQSTQVLSYTNDPEDAPIIHLVNSLIEKAHALKASDIHIEPGEEEVIIRYRIDGSLRIMNRLKPQAIIRPIVTRIKIMGQMDVGERRRPQDGRIHFSDFNPQINIELRVSLVPLKFGEKAVMRLLDSNQNLQALDSMGFSKQDLVLYRQKLNAPYGMILHVGPTGSGKTTTLYAALNEINKSDINIQTIENPVEYNMPGINQLEIKHEIGLNFSQVLRAYLRQDPDVILVGEIRDEETAHVACEAAMTGHRLLSTLHTNDAASTLIRLIEMGIKPYIISSSVLLICAQRLLRKLCPHCKQAIEADAEVKQLLNQEADQNILHYQAVGCSLCNQTGYSGRIGVYEILIPNQSLRQAMNVKGVTPEYIKEIALRDSNMTTLYQAGIEKVLKGITSLEEITLKILPDENRDTNENSANIYLPLPVEHRS